MHPGMKDLLTALNPQYQLGILSNTTIFESVVPEKWGIANLFDQQVYSWQIGSLKPSKKNFDAICEKLQVTPSECIFIDDGRSNISAAQAYGFVAIKYENTAQLRSDLRKLGVTA